VLKEYICALSKLHTEDGGSALRYISKPEEKGPVPLLLIDTFTPVMKEALL
jgi:hypothetical protein